MVLRSPRWRSSTWLNLLLLTGLVLLLVAGDRPLPLAHADPAHLFLLSAVPSPRGDIWTGRVSVVDPASWQEIQTFPAGDSVDVAVSPDGAHLYIAGADAPISAGGSGADVLTAFDRASGRQLWRVAIPNRSTYHDDGLSSLVVGPDGQRLYLYSRAEVSWDDAHISSVSWWLQAIDAASGRILSETILLPDCGAAAFQLVPRSDTLIASCFELGDLRLVDLPTRRVESTISLLGPGSLAGTALSPDGRWLYAVSTTLEVTVVDVAKRAISHQLTLERPGDWQDPGFVALTADGSRLVVGENVQAIAGTDTDVLLQAYDTRTWQKVAGLAAGRPLDYALAPAPKAPRVYAWGSITSPPPWSPGTVVFVVDLEHPVLRPFLMRPGEHLVRLFPGP